MSAIKKQTFLQGAAILVGANMLVKLIGALFKIPLASILGEEGMALFNTAYSLYATMFVIATAGLPVAVSKMVSESAARHNYAETQRIFRAAALLLSLIGLIGTLILSIGAHIFAGTVLSSPQSYFAILAISPAIFFIAAASAFRGYFQGFSNMTPTAMSEVAEALGKLLIGLLLAYFLIPKGIHVASAGAVSGVTAGAFFACAILLLTYMKNKRHLPHSTPAASTMRSARSIFLSLLKIAVPITIGAAVSSLTNIIDMVMIRQRLQSLLVTPELSQTLTLWFGLNAQEALDGARMLIRPSEILYGAYSGFAVPLFNLPPTIVASLSMSVVPAISGAYALNHIKQTQRLTESTIRITILFSLPCAVGLSLLASPILTAVYNNARSQDMLSVLAIAVLFVCLVSVTTAILQATGNVMSPVWHMLVGGLVKIAANHILIGIPAINIGGAPLSTLLCYAVIAALNLIAVIRIVQPRLRPSELIVKPLIAAVGMGFGVWAVYQLLARAVGIAPLKITLSFLRQTIPATPVDGIIRIKTLIVLLCAIGAGALFYFLLLLIAGGIQREDIEMLPRGKSIAKKMGKLLR